MRRTCCAVILIQSIFLNACLGELTVEKKQKILNGFIDSLNNLPNEPYAYEEGVLLDAQKTDLDNGYKISVRLKASDIHNLDSIKILRCTGSVLDLGENGVSVQSGHACQEEPEGPTTTAPEAQKITTELPVQKAGPVQLFNEVQSNSEVTSGEQFVAIPRSRINVPCIGCASHVDTNAAGVAEIAQLGIRHLNIHDLSSKHTLNRVVEVERQVQVVSGVRYILTLLVDYNNCTTPGAEPCPVTVPCKISILEKPWEKLPDGLKYRAILANNCTIEWQFGDMGEVLPSEDNENNELYPDSSNSDDNLKVVHTNDVQAQPNQEKPITDEIIKNVEEQIIPLSELAVSERHVTSTDSTLPVLEHMHKDETVKNYNQNSVPVDKLQINEPNTLSEDKKQAVDDLMNFFNFAGLPKSDNTNERQRSKRSYANDLQVLALAKKFKKVKEFIDNANYVHNLAQKMVDYLNELDMVVKNRVLDEVLAAEEEFENNQHFFYLQVVTVTPCNRAQCTSIDNNRKICNGIVDGTNEKFPQILNAFCYDDYRKPFSTKAQSVSFDDPVLLKLAKRAFEKIESESSKNNAMKILRILDATTQKASGTLTRLSVSLAYTNCNKSLEFYKRANCSIIEEMGANVCEVDIHEKKKAKDMKITYVCSERGIHESFSDAHFKKNKGKVTDPEIHNMVNDALQYLEMQSNRNNKQKLVELKSVATKPIAGLLTHIVFTVGYTDCPNEKVVDINYCRLLPNEPYRECEAQVWHRPWLEDGRQVKIDCDGKPYNIENNEISDNRKKRSTAVGGLTEQSITDPKFKELAQESLQKYLQTKGTTLGDTAIKVTRARTQIVSGSKTLIDFDVLPANADTFKCHSEVWEQPWLKKKEIKVDCDINNKANRAKRQIPGGINDRNPDEPQFKALAEKALQQYLDTTGATLSEQVIKVTRARIQVVNGIKTFIDFTVLPANGDAFNCNAYAFDFLVSSVHCNRKDNRNRLKRQVPGGATEQDPSDPKFKQLAEESLQKYVQTSGTTLGDTAIKVTRARTQVVSGSKTFIDFDVLPANGDTFKCHSEVWEQTWLNKKKIEVDCDINNKANRAKRQIPGGINDRNPDEPQFKALAEKALQQYLDTTGATLSEQVIKVTRARIQVVNGIKTFIDFTVLPANGDAFNCNAYAFDFLVSSVHCNRKDNRNRLKRQVPGGATEQDPSDPKFKQLAEESLQKYVQTSGTTLGDTAIKVTRARTQVVSGSKTFIDFDVLAANGDTFKCHSEVWEQPWLNKKIIEVDCDPNDKQRVKRYFTGGVTEKDPSDPRFKKLAEESLQKYLENSGSTLSERVIEVISVTVQVVSGVITTVDFNVQPRNGDAFQCHSEVWEQPWLNKKDIKVDCDMINKVTRVQLQIDDGIDEVNPDKPEYKVLAEESVEKHLHTTGAMLDSRVKRQVHGGVTEKDPNDPKYTQLAEESLQKYVQTSGATVGDKVVKVTKVTYQVVSGSSTRLYFEVYPSNGDALTCHSEVFEQPWLKKKVISVDCKINNILQKRYSRAISGNKMRRGSARVDDPNKPEYKIMAVESLKKYLNLQDSNVRHKVVEVKRVTAQVVAGKIYEIDFTAAPTCSVNEATIPKCSVNNTIMFCHTQVWSRPWLKANDIDVTCNSDSNGNQHSVDDDEGFERKRRKVLSNQDGTNTITDIEDLDINQETINDNTVKYRDLTKEVVLKFEKISNAKYMHKVTKIHHLVNQQLNEGILTSLEFSIAQTVCLIGEETDVDDCKLREPTVTLSCISSVWERTWIYLKDIKVSCKKNNVHYLRPLDWDDEIPGARDAKMGREKRQAQGEEDDYIDEDLKFYYADRAVTHLNDISSTHNLQKLITVHAMDEIVQMGARMIRMYIETAVTYCLRRQRVPDLSNCDEIDGLSHKLCHVRLWPLPDDDLIVQHVAVVCDDEKDFYSITGLSIQALITASIKEVEKSPNVQFKLVHQGEPYIIPTLSSKHPIKINFVVISTNCSKDIDVYRNRDLCFVDSSRPATTCQSAILLAPESMDIKAVNAKCNAFDRKKRSVSFSPAKNNTDDITISKLVDESLQKLEGASFHRYKQRVMQINSYTTKIKKGRVTTIDFDVGYTSCLKYEYVKNISSCEFIDHLPRRHCISYVLERLWVDNGRNIEVTCEDDETRLEAHIEYENAEKAMDLANEALKHIEAKYPHPNKLKVIRIFSLEKQAVAGFHYRMKIEVGFTDCLALSVKSDCKLKKDADFNRFCRVNIWIRPWTDQAPNFRVSCDYQESLTAEIYHIAQAEHLFYDFLTTYRPDYMEDNEEMQRRFKIFSENVRKVHELNIHERGTARYAMTRFSDLSYEEFSSRYLGLKAGLKNANNIPMIQADIPKLRLPEQFDWRDHGAVTDVKDQGSCGSCWAFSVTGNIEGQWKLQTGKLVSLSEQELVDCDKLDQGCNGGLMDNAYRAIEELGGLEAEGDYPYEGEDDKCAFNKSLTRVQISGAVNISSNETEMAKWLVGNGPISIGINANAMQFYVGGISHPWKMLCSPSNLDHGVLVVGFGVKDYPLFHKRLPYWVVKNSWGPQWGEQGYYRVYRGDGTCGLNKMASSAVV